MTATGQRTIPNSDLEVWLVGPPAAVARVVTGLGRLGHIAEHSGHNMTGADAGRIRAHLRVTPLDRKGPSRDGSS